MAGGERELDNAVNITQDDTEVLSESLSVNCPISWREDARRALRPQGRCSKAGAISEAIASTGNNSFS